MESGAENCHYSCLSAQKMASWVFCHCSCRLQGLGLPFESSTYMILFLKYIMPPDFTSAFEQFTYGSLCNRNCFSWNAKIERSESKILTWYMSLLWAWRLNFTGIPPKKENFFFLLYIYFVTQEKKSFVIYIKYSAAYQYIFHQFFEYIFMFFP